MAADVVMVLDQSLTQVFASARPLKATVKETSKTMEHPLETGAVVTDHRILQPTEIELSMVLASLDYRAVYQQVRDIFKRGDLLTVQTRTGSYENMIIEGLPHEESPDAMDAVPMALSLHEVTFVAPQFAVLKVRRPGDGRTKGRGEQQPQESKKQSSILSGLFR